MTLGMTNLTAAEQKLHKHFWRRLRPFQDNEALLDEFASTVFGGANLIALTRWLIAHGLEGYNDNHRHGPYSVLDGASKVDRFMQRTSDLIAQEGMRAPDVEVFTDHGNVMGAVQYESSARVFKRPYVFGVEAYLHLTEFWDELKQQVQERRAAAEEESGEGVDNGPYFHGNLYAYNRTGIQNIGRLLSDAEVNNFYRHGLVPMDALADPAKNRGIIHGHGCWTNYVPKIIRLLYPIEQVDPALWLDHSAAANQQLLDLFPDEGWDAVRQVRDLLWGIWGDRLVFEVMDHHEHWDRVITLIVLAIAREDPERQIAVMAANDTHYVSPEDADVQDVLLAIATGKRLDDPNRFRFTSREYWYKGYSDMMALFPWLDEATKVEILTCARAVAWFCAGCQFEAGKEMYVTDEGEVRTRSVSHYPKFRDLGDYPDAEAMLRDLAWKGLQDRYKVLGKLRDEGEASLTEPERAEAEALRRRFESEIAVYRQKGVIDYPLVVRRNIEIAHNLHQYLTEEEIQEIMATYGIPREEIVCRTGPGRGSACGSIVCYGLGITQLDPIRYKLYFERFLNPERDAMPDVDTDFEKRFLTYVNKALRRYWGLDKTANINALAYLGAKSAFRDVCRVHGIHLNIVDMAAKTIPAAPGQDISLTEALAASDEFRAFYENSPALQQRLIEPLRDPALKEKYRQDLALMHRVIDIARQVEGMPRQPGTHAGGILITDVPITDVFPVMRVGGQNGSVNTQWDKDDVEHSGGMKIDRLGLRNLDIIVDTLKSIALREGIWIDVFQEHLGTETITFRGRRCRVVQLPEDDAEVFAMIASALTDLCFQIAGDGMKEMLLKVRPSTIDDVMAAVAIFRPGAMQFIDPYANRKQGHEEVYYPLPEVHHPALQPVLGLTYGIPIYQEEVMGMAQVLAGFSLGQADLLRRAMGKKSDDLMHHQRLVFIYGQRDFPDYKYTEQWGPVADLKFADPQKQAFWQWYEAEFVKAPLKLVPKRDDAGNPVVDETGQPVMVPKVEGALRVLPKLDDQYGIARRSEAEYHKLAGDFFDVIARFSGYGFNAAHSAAYGYLAYVTAYLKRHFPVYFIAASLKSVQGDSKKTALYIRTAHEMGLRVLPPDINQSDMDTTVIDEKTMRFGLRGIKNIGGTALAIIRERTDGGPFRSFWDVLVRVKASTKVMETLIDAGAMDSFGMHRAQAHRYLEILQPEADRYRKDAARGICSFLEIPEVAEAAQALRPAPAVPLMPEEDLLAREKQLMGVYLSGHPLERYTELLTRQTTALTLSRIPPFTGKKWGVTLGLIVESVTRKKHKNGQNKGQEWGDILFSDLDGQFLNAQCYASRDKWRTYGPLVQEGVALLVTGSLEASDPGGQDDDGAAGETDEETLAAAPRYRLVVDEIRTLPKIAAAPKPLRFTLPADLAQDAVGMNALIASLRDVLAGSPGATPLELVVGSRVHRLASAYWVTPSEALYAALRRLHVTPVA